MAPGILNKLRRRQSVSLPSRTIPQPYIHHASTPPDWPTSPSQATPDVYITSPPEDDGLLTSICVHRALEHEPKKLRKQEDRASLPLPPAVTLNDPTDVEGPPVFRRTSLQASDVVLPKKASDAAKRSVKPSVAEEPARVQWDDKQVPLARVSSGRDDGLKAKGTLRHRASKVFKSFANRESLNFGADKRNSQSEARSAGHPSKRRNTLSDSPRPAFNMLAQTATAHAIPGELGQPSTPPPTRTSGEGRRRSSTLGHVDFTPRSSSPPMSPPAASQDAVEESIVAAPLEPAADIAEATSSKTPGSPKPKKLQRRRSKNAFSHLFTLKSEKTRSPPPAKPTEEVAPPVPVIPQELAKAVAEPDTPEVAQSSTAATTPKTKRFRRNRRTTIGSVSHIDAELAGMPSSRSAVPDTPKTPTSLRSRPFSIVDLRKGFSVRGIGKGKGKLFSAKSSPSLGSPATPVQVTGPVASESGELPETVMQRYKMSRPPPLQSTESPQASESSPAPANEEPTPSPTTVEFEAPDNAGTQLPSPTESDGPVTPMFGAQEESTPAGLAPAIELDESKSSVEVPELSFTAPTSEESDQTDNRPSTASEATLLSDDPLFSSLTASSTIRDLDLQLREPSTKTSTLDAHLQLGSLRFDNFSFDTNVF